VSAVEAVKRIKETEKEAVEIIENAKKEGERIKLDAIEEGKRIIEEAERDARKKVEELIRESEEMARKEAEDIIITGDSEIEQMESVAKIKLRSLKLEDVLDIFKV